MEANWWPQSQGDSSPMDAFSAVDWRSQLQPEARQWIASKIMETLKRRLSISIPEGLNELRKIAIRFEEKIYTAATSQSDYLRRIQMKMLSMETKTQPSAPINPTNAGVNQNPPDSGSPGIQSQINNPGQIMQQSLPSNSSAAMQGSSGLAPLLTSMSGLALSNISGVTQASNLQNVPGIPQTSVNNAIGQASVDSTAQTGHAGAVDWQEECYQKVLSMKELYYADLSEFHHKINVKLQQQEALLPPGKHSDQCEKLKGYKIMLDRMLQLLQISSKNSVPIGLKEKLPMYEKQIVNMVTSQRQKDSSTSTTIPKQHNGHCRPLN